MEKNLIEKVDEVHEFMNSVKSGKIKKIKIPRKAKVSRSKIKKGYIGILRIDENSNITGEKARLNEGAIELSNGTFHSTNGEEILMWNGKHPVIIQPTWSKNPINVKELKSTNETYGQLLIMAKMLKSVIVKKKSGGSALIWIGIAVAGFIAYSLLKGGA